MHNHYPYNTRQTRIGSCTIQTYCRIIYNLYPHKTDILSCRVLHNSYFNTRETTLAICTISLHTITRQLAKGPYYVTVNLFWCMKQFQYFTLYNKTVYTIFIFKMSVNSQRKVYKNQIVWLCYDNKFCPETKLRPHIINIDWKVKTFQDYTLIQSVC